ncbi:hypothetical protein NQZ68_010037 [Dissostichus eleginoides]|nr:hypothetical protein NQZ68_010037 [Dissostichus eleginoides]
MNGSRGWPGWKTGISGAGGGGAGAGAVRTLNWVENWSKRPLSYTGRKRPMSSMCPAILFDKNNKVKMVVGGSGGTKITTSIAQVILNALFFDYDLKKAVLEPRLHNQLDPNATEAEPDFDKNVLEGLALKNHEIKYLKSTIAVVQAVVRYEDGLHAQSDSRKWAYAAGY